MLESSLSTPLRCWASRSKKLSETFFKLVSFGSLDGCTEKVVKRERERERREERGERREERGLGV